jgi:hypothetical protein
MHADPAARTHAFHELADSDGAIDLNSWVDAGLRAGDFATVAGPKAGVDAQRFDIYSEFMDKARGKRWLNRDDCALLMVPAEHFDAVASVRGKVFLPEFMHYNLLSE